MAVILAIAVAGAVLAGVSVLAAMIRRWLGARDPHATSNSQRNSEAEYLTRNESPFV